MILKVRKENERKERKGKEKKREEKKRKEKRGKEKRREEKEKFFYLDNVLINYLNVDEKLTKC